ncbi:RimK family alpha-L-glutamate ligase [Methanolobus zinderi]|jgi:tetrahydromethanopterin:alpha-L-glutamate ligase|uniref:RimK family alpha-L-glutamate ligase n=1 Tax=Methanolobus zinderi TaxID=536044 RepID=A0A7D5EFX9_9EURY|nr:tetrahydromethanopterin:alpha-L-glutamate ligase [Methanolobus zinderi]KXS44219.1 MAG: alpha-L-glutamate ligase, RimK family [Methanolobus sp. T82-4]QLC50514.1 RimK family alpha-L-glutamate ligase [Methanolobus zinderi]
MTELGIAVTDPEDWTAKAFVKNSKKKGIKARTIDLRKAKASIGSGRAYSVDEIGLGELDALIVRDMGSGKNDAVTFRFDLLRQLEAEGVLVVNPPSAIQNAANKYHCSYLFSGAGIPVPETRMVQDIESAMDILEGFRDVVLKPVFGFKGIGISRIKDGEIIRPDGSSGGKDIFGLLDSMLREKGIVFIQEFIENSGRDIRAFVVDDEVTGSIYRKAAPGSWLNNLSQGGNPERCTLDSEQENICIEAARVAGTLFAGVDIIEGPDGPKILEINATPSGAGIYSAWNIDVTENIIDAVLKRL